MTQILVGRGLWPRRMVGSRVPRDRNQVGRSPRDRHISISTKGTRIVNSGSPLSCAFHQS